MKHVANEFPTECMNELIEQIKNKEFSLDMAANVFCLLAWITAYAKDWFGPTEWGSDQSRLSVARQLGDLNSALTGQPNELSGPVSNAMIMMLIKMVLPKLLEYLKEDGFDWIVDLLDR